jgi:hypothetical protein
MTMPLALQRHPHQPREAYLLMEVYFMLRRAITAIDVRTRLGGVLLAVVALVVMACNNGGGSGY